MKVETNIITSIAVSNCWCFDWFLLEKFTCLLDISQNHFKNYFLTFRRFQYKIQHINRIYQYFLYSICIRLAFSTMIHLRPHVAIFYRLLNILEAAGSPDIGISPITRYQEYPPKYYFHLMSPYFHLFLFHSETHKINVKNSLSCC